MTLFFHSCRPEHVYGCFFGAACISRVFLDLTRICPVVTKAVYPLHAMTKPPQAALIAFGGNLGDPIVTLRRALPMIEEVVGHVAKLSSLYETKALTLRGEVHANYINAVLEVSTTREPEEILADLLRIEHELGRDRSPDKRWEPRTIDLDLLFVGSRVMNTPSLQLPHPELFKRDFVVEPLAEIAGAFTHPLLGKTMRELQRELAESGSQRFVMRIFPFES